MFVSLNFFMPINTLPRLLLRMFTAPYSFKQENKFPLPFLSFILVFQPVASDPGAKFTLPLCTNDGDSLLSTEGTSSPLIEFACRF